MRAYRDRCGMHSHSTFLKLASLSVMAESGRRVAARILAFGDSLTAGYYRSGLSFAPWAPVVQRIVNVKAVDHIGLSGWTTDQMAKALDDAVCNDLAGRKWSGLRHRLGIAASRGAPYDCVLVLGGTNDLAQQTTAAEIVRNLEKLHRVAHAHGACSVAFSIPPSRAAQHVKWLGALRSEANDAIRAWAEAQPRELVAFVDGATLVPMAEEDSEFWEPDGLHMTAKGYEEFGTRMAPLIEPFVCACVDRREAARKRAPREDTKWPGWRTDALVWLSGLKAAAQHNGKRGRLLGDKPMENERWGVQLIDEDVQLAVKAENIRLVGEAAEEAELNAEAIDPEDLMAAEINRHKWLSD